MVGATSMMTEYEKFCEATGTKPSKFCFRIAFEEERACLGSDDKALTNLVRFFHKPMYKLSANNMVLIRSSVLWAQMLGAEYATPECV